jgi:hypothetical protein
MFRCNYSRDRRLEERAFEANLRCKILGAPMSALPPIADIDRSASDVRFVPKAEVGNLEVDYDLEL